MGEIATNRLWGTAPHEGPSQYARMIPGVATSPRPRVVQAKSASAAATVARSVIAIDETTIRHTRPRTAIQQLLPQPTGDPFLLVRVITQDLIVVAAMCGAVSLFISPAWGLPWAHVPVFAVLVTLFAFSEGLYRSAVEPYPAESVPSLARSTLFATGLVFIAAQDEMSLPAAFITFAASLTGLVSLHRLKQMAAKKRCRETEPRNVLVVGAGPIALSIAQVLRNDPLHRTNVCGFVDEKLPLSPTVLGRIEDLDWLARAEFIDEVILALPNQPAQAREAAEIAFRNHLDIRAVPDLPQGPWPEAGVDHIGEVPIVTLHREPLPGAALFLKRSIDIVGAALGLVLAGPLMALVALLIRLESPGPVLYSAKRTGRKGHPFRCHKFRSMVTNAEHLKQDLRDRNQRQGPIFKIDDDPRITRIGRIIRRYSLDELPQLWNVLMGEMSLVGPRPHPVDEVNHYELQHFRRLDVKPGLTGLWQITARDCPSFELNMHLDLTYIETWSLRLDLLILARTVRVLFVPEGA
jgi:exopolysaccharide biosynthesis polyprenyl glycosylphosphotransferase